MLFIYMYKTCSKCDVHKILNQYHKLKNGLFGYHSICKQCRSLVRKRKNYQVQCRSKTCMLCMLRLEADKFYRNKSYRKIT